MNSAISILMIVCLWCVSLNVQALGSGFSIADMTYSKFGLVLAKTMVLDPDSGQPILVVVNKKGEEVSDLGPRVSPLDTMSIWNADGYRADAAAYTALLNELPSEVTKNHCIIELERYGIDHCGDAYVTVSTAGGDPELVAIEYPDQYSGAPGMLIRSIANAKYVVLRHSSTIVDPRLLSSDGPVLLVSRIDLNNLDRSVINDTSVRSLLLTEEGRVHYSTEHNITYRTGYFKPTDKYGENQSSLTFKEDKERALGPIEGVVVRDIGDFNNSFSTVTDESGQYFMQYYLPPCPCLTFHYPSYLLAEIPYRNFNPVNSDRLPFLSFPIFTPIYDVCTGYHYCPLNTKGVNLIAQAVELHLQSINNAVSLKAKQFSHDLYLNAMIITGEGQLVNTQRADETRYAIEQQGTFENVNPNILGFDFDLDRRPDQAVLHEDEYFIYLGGRAPEFDESNHPINEDLRRRPDQINDYQDRGLLESISIEDLKQTDLYIYRVSTGELLVERQNLKSEEPAALSSGGVNESNGASHFFYRQMMRGVQFDVSFSPSGRLSDWWSKADIRLEMFGRNQADFLRMGESVQIIAINRPTGYIGSVTAVLQFNTETGRDTLDVPIGKLLLRPPNLKIRAERRTETELGLTKGEIKDYLIGSEGSGLTSDEYIVIKTEWFDHDGRPLPSDLPGYSGILAKLVGSQKLGSDNACTSSIDPINIQPGSRIQLLKLGDNCGLGTEHYYVYVCGHYESDSARSKCFSFGQTNDIGRPSYYVPVQVPFYNEFASREAYKRYRYGMEDGVIEEGRDAPEPVYEWFYRPEMQFSVFDLDMDEINRVSLSEEGDVDTINIIKDESPVISSSDDSIDVFYSLLDPKYAPLPMFGPDRELVLALGEQEVQVSLGDDNQVSFDNLESLSQLNPEDFLSMRLYANNDAANILWEWSFEIATEIALNRSYDIATFNASANSSNALADVTDSYLRLPIQLANDSLVNIEILDEDREPVATLISNGNYMAGVYGFVVVYEDLESHFDVGDTFYLAVNKRHQTTGVLTRDLYKGELGVRISSEMLGQVIEHDNLIQRGALTLRREDMQLKGLGPQLSFIRSYTNESQLGRDTSVLGPGWSHNHHIYLQVVASSDEQGFYSNNLPRWIQGVRSANRPQIVPWSSFPDVEVQPYLVSVSNGGLFKRVSNQWLPARGYHGRLALVEGQYHYTSKEGVRYVFEAQPTGRQYLLQQIIDRNGNRVRYQYENDRGERRLTRVTDAVDRSLVFTYQRQDYGSRLISVSSSEADIELEFSYSVADEDELIDPYRGALVKASREDFSERYTYTRTAEDAVANLSSTIDALGRTTEYVYLAPADVPNTLLNFAKGVQRTDVVGRVNYPEDTGSASFEYVSGDQNRRRVIDLNGNEILYTLNTYGNPVRIESPLDHAVEMTWTIDNDQDDVLVLSRTDALGRETTYEYDAQGNITRQEDPIGVMTQTWHQDYSLLLTRTDRNENTIRHTYDDAGNLLSQTDAEGNETSHTYNDEGQLLTTEHPGNGGETAYEYDDYGNLSKQTLPEGSSYAYVNDARGRRTRETDANGHATEYSYDELDRLTEVQDPADGTLKYTYDAKGNKTSETNKLGLELTYAYDARDRVVSITRSLDEATQTFTYDGNSNVLTETDWLGNTTSHTYDALNRRTQSTNPLDDSMTMVYDLVGNLTGETDYRGNNTRHVYDEGNRRTETINALDDSMEMTYDQEGYVLSETDYAGRQTTYVYDKRYLKTEQTNALEDTRSWAYDARGNLISETDEEGRVTRYEYDRQNRRTLFTDALSFETEYTYDANGNVTAVKDRRGFTTQTEYDSLNRPTVVTDPDDFEVSYTYDAAGNPTVIEDGNGNKTSYTYDALSRQLTETSPVDGVITYTYDANDNVRTKTDAIGTVYAYVYDALNRLTTETHAQSDTTERTQSYTYDANGNRLTQVDFRGHTAKYAYDVLNRMQSMTDALDQTSQYTYDAVGNLLSETDRRDNATTYAYDDLNRVITTTDALDQSITMTYDAVGNQLTDTDKRGTETRHTYDALNRLLSSEKPDGNGVRVALVRHTYDGEGNITATLDANNNEVTYTYNNRGLQASIVHPDDTQISYTYDGAGNQLTETDEIEQVTTYAYDAANRQISVTNPASEETSYAYDLNNNRTRVTRPLGNATNLTYDALNRLTQVTDGASNSTRYTYDANDNQLSHVDANTHTVSYEYDELNRRITHTQPNDLVTRYGYDAEGNITSSTDANGRVFSYTYDELNRQTEQVLPSISSPYLETTSIKTAYDANNNVIEIVETKTDNRTNTSVTDTTQKVYDLLDRETSNTQRGQAVSYQYDANGNRTQVSAPGGSTTYSYDNRNRLTTMVFNDETSTHSYTGDSKLAAVSYANNTVTRYSYDAADRTTELSNERGNGDIISRFEYSYDANGNRTEQVEVQNGFTSNTNETTTYTFDNADRLVSYTVTDGSDTSITTRYSYDANYNRTAEEVTQKIGETETKIKDRTLTYDANNRLTQIENNLGSDDSQTITYTYDNNGNRLTKTDAIAETPETSAFAYNSLNQLVQVIRGPPGSGDVVGLYDYDYAGMRIRQLNSDRGDIQVIYDGQSILEERDSSNGLLAHYRYGDRLVSLKTSSDEHYYHYSGLNTTANLTNGSGGIQASYRTDIWGNITQESGSSPNRQIFTGHQTDQNTGLIYMKARHYDPEVGGFLTQDSYLGELNTPPSLHRYLYVYGNPTVYVDPTGHFAVLEGMTDRLGEMRQEIIDDAAESNLLMAGVKGLGAGLVGVLEVGTGALNLAGDLAVNAIADKDSDSFFVQDSRRSLGETKQSFSQVATAVKENPLGVAESIGRGIVDTASGIAQGDARSVAQGAAFGFEALTGGGLAKSTASSTKSAAKTVTSKMKESQRVQSASLTVETTVAAGGNQLRALGTSAVNGARAAAKNRSGDLDESARLARTQPYGSSKVPQGKVSQQVGGGAREGAKSGPKLLGHTRIGHTVPWGDMSKAQRKAFQHSYSRHADEMGLPKWSQKNAEGLRKQFNNVVGHIRETGTHLGTRMKPFNGKSTKVNYYESNLQGSKYYYYETMSGQFISAGKAR